MSRKYFGTDGIRGRVGESPMTPEFALRLGWAAGRVLGQASGSRVLIGKDTRRSGYLFESALEAGLAAAGVETHLLGPMPTPGVAHLTRVLHAQAGIVVSASHNPHYDNGIKFFSADGSKLDDATEAAIETMLDSDMQCVAPERIGRVQRVNDAAGRYIEFCKSTFGEGSLDGLHLVVDCANGAAYRIAPAVFAELGARVDVIADQPDGLNINRDCGSTHLDALSKRVLSRGAHLGIALDGDADRCLMVDARGEPVDGDQLLYVIARMRQQQGTLGSQVVGTQMSNLGLEHALRDIGVALARAQVGDRHVLEMLKAQGATLGGETSGHLICLDRATTGDGIVGALQVLRAIVDSGRDLAELVADVVRLPQCLINVRVGGNARAALQLPEVCAALAAAEASLGERGRILLRASGTEPLVRVMVEAPDDAETRQIAERLAASVRSAHEFTKEKAQ